MQIAAGIASGLGYVFPENADWSECHQVVAKFAVAAADALIAELQRGAN